MRRRASMAARGAVFVGALTLMACAATAARPAPTARVSLEHAQLDATLAEPECRVGHACVLRVRIEALDGFHLNEQYPFQFRSEPIEGVAFDAPGPLLRDSATVGTLLVRFTPMRAGLAPIAGLVRLCVCSEERCVIEAPRVALSVAVR